jgi:hypothetical protein
MIPTDNPTASCHHVSRGVGAMTEVKVSDRPMTMQGATFLVMEH